jgi:hypothetical protein
VDGVEIAGVAVGIPTVASLLLAIKIGRWQGTIEQILKNHDEAIKGQKETCKEQKAGCAKTFDHITDRLNGIKDK